VLHITSEIIYICKLSAILSYVQFLHYTVLNYDKNILDVEYLTFIFDPYDREGMNSLRTKIFISCRYCQVHVCYRNIIYEEPDINQL
jgi:hypothetical protein